jgi:hypothetical protein
VAENPGGARPDRGGSAPPDGADAPEEQPNPYAVGPQPPPDRPEGRPAGPRAPAAGMQRPAGDNHNDARGPRQGGRPPGESEKALRRRVRLAAVLAAVAAVTAVTLPPVGVALGIGLLIVGARLRRDPRAREVGVAATWIPYVGGGFAIVVGVVMTALAMFFSGELADLRECLAGANTRVAEANCQEEFRQRIEQRLPGTG